MDRDNTIVVCVTIVLALGMLLSTWCYLGRRWHADDTATKLARIAQCRWTRSPDLCLERNR